MQDADRPVGDVSLSRKLALSDRAATLGAIGWAFCARYSATPGEVRIVEYGRNAVVLDITSPADGQAVAREAVVPGWHLTRNGRDWPFTEGGAVALQWRVPRGSARYRLTYAPPGLAAGFACGVAGLLALGYLLLDPRNSQRLARR